MREGLVRSASLLLAAEGASLGLAAGSPRAVACMRRLRGVAVEPLPVEVLAAVPDWVGWPEAERDRLACLAAAAHLAPRLARTVDGAVLGVVADAVGDAVLDWAIALGEGLVFAEPLTASPKLEALGRGLLLASLPPLLGARLGGLFEGAAPVSADSGAHAVELALSVWGELGVAMPGAAV